VTQDVRSDAGGLGPGDQLAGYQIQEQIGRGGMAVVYRALDSRLGRLVALKVLAPQLNEDEAFRQRFIRESRAAAGVDHPNIIPVFDAGEAGGVLFIAMRYVGYGDVRTLIDAKGRLAVGRAASITVQVASALDAAHSHGLVHRDVKPGNILLSQATGRDDDHVYLSDFGLSKHSLTPSTLTSTGQFLGTLDYVSPEQIQGQPVDGRADQYALACTVVEMLTGRPPFSRDDTMALMWAQLEAEPPRPTERRPDLPPSVDQVIAAAMAKSPVYRFPSCMEFASALTAALDPGAARPESTQAPAGPGGALAAGAAATAAAQARPGPTAESHRAAPGARAPGAHGEASPADAFRVHSYRPEIYRPTSFRPQDFRPSRRIDRPDGAAAGQSQHVPGIAVPTGQTAADAVPQPGARSSAGSNPVRPGTWPAQPDAGRQARGRQQKGRGRVVAAILISLVGLAAVAGIGYKLLHHPATTTPPAGGPAVSGAAVSATLTPANTVRAYFRAINQHRYGVAWQISGETESFPDFRAGFAATARDTVRILSVRGDVVTARLTALQTNGKTKVFEGTYTVTHGVFTSSNVRETH
jgi:Protein kinase domain